MPKFDIKMSAVGLLLSIYGELELHVVDRLGLVAVEIEGKPYGCTGDDVRDLESRGWIAIDDAVTLTQSGRYWAGWLAKRAYRGKITTGENGKAVIT